MNILFISHRFPYPPNKGEKIRVYNQIRYLAKENKLHLVCLSDKRIDRGNVQPLEKICASIEVIYQSKLRRAVHGILAFFSSTPFSVAYFKSWIFKKKVINKLAIHHFDLIIVSSSSMAQYVSRVKGITRIIDFMDVDSEKWRSYSCFHRFPLSWFFREEYVRLGKYELELGETFNRSIFVSEQEASLFKRHAKKASVSVISNGVDLEYFPSERNDSCQIHQKTLIFLGAMNYFPNIDAVQYFCREIFPLIRKELPETKFIIVGQSPTGNVRKLERHTNVTVTGEVSDIRPYLRKATVSVVPLRIAGGIQNKVLESLAAGVPVVCTSKAVQGTFVTTNNGVSVADDSEEFAKYVLNLLQNFELQQQFSKQGRAYVEKYHRWENWNARLGSVIDQLKNSDMQKIREIN